MSEPLREKLKRSDSLVHLVRTARKVYRRRGLLSRGRRIEAYLRSHNVRKLQIGSGMNLLEGWLNTDLFPGSRSELFLDATQRFPFPDASFDYVWSEHQIEHMPYVDGMTMLGECFRVLKPGGRLRIATPNLRTLLAVYTSDRSEEQNRYIDCIAQRFLPDLGPNNRDVFVINNAFRNWHHQFLFDRETLQEALEKTGFAEVVEFRAGESEDPSLRGIESHGRAMEDEEMNRFETLVLEGVRPR